MSGPKTVVFDSRNVWRTSFIVLAVVAIALLLKFLLEDGGSVIFIVLMAWFASIAIEPAVGRLARHMKRGLATALVMLSILIFFIVFGATFGNLLFNQIADLLRSLHGLLDSALDGLTNVLILVMKSMIFGNNSTSLLQTQLNMQPPFYRVF